LPSVDNLTTTKKTDDMQEWNGGAVVVHGGAGNSKNNEDGCAAAARAALARLRAGDPALAAAVAAVRSLEDDGRFNAGRGAVLGMDGETIEMSASVMDTGGALGAVAGVRNVRHPILLAEAVTQTPHCLIVGEGTDRLARLLGLEAAAHDRERALRSYRETMQELATERPVLPGVPNETFSRLWNYPVPWKEAMKRHGSGTVGAVVREGPGRFAVATSTGGVAPALLGRVGDTPVVGSGFYCGPAGAIGATGIGEAIMRRLLARTVYGWLEGGMALREALDAGIALFDDDTDVGLIGVTSSEHGSASNRPMPTWAAAVEARATERA
jgi:beta-aspartyl-peptidase (threonine type)